MTDEQLEKSVVDMYKILDELKDELYKIMGEK